MFIEMHILQNFAPSNLNRDDTGAPKDCDFGGYRRARISSQCLKRAISRESNFATLLAGQGGLRTRRLILEVAERLTEQRPVPERYVTTVSKVFAEGGIERPRDRKNEAEKDNTKLLIFIDTTGIDKMANVFRSRWDGLAAEDKATRDESIKELGTLLASEVTAPNIALFGRMIEIDAQKPFGKLNLGIDSACQVAHALSTNKANMDFDFFTAVDDLLPHGETGAGMMGTIEFNSSCYYRYSSVDMEQLKANLGNNEESARNTLRAFMRASIAAIPSGKQNSMAAQNPPSFVLAVARHSGLWSLANAFVKPVSAAGEGLIDNSIVALDRHWGDLIRMYGDDSIAAAWACALGDAVQLNHLTASKATVVPSVAGLVDATLRSVTFTDQRVL